MAELTQLGRYELTGEPMTGGMGAVYIGIDPVLDRKVAVKILHRHLTSQKGFRDRFLREAKILAKLKHKNITQVYEAGDSDGGLFLAMEYVEGMTLEDAIFRGMYRSPKVVLPIVRQVCEALDYAHSEGIIHRDIKPSNIMVKPNGEVMLMDFGIARLDGQSRMTQDGQTIGTPHYMSPEQCKGLTIDAKSDLYSLAIVVYEMLSGARPFEGENLLSIINRQINDTPSPISVHVAGMPPHMVNAINRVLSKNPADRPQTAMQFYNELAGAASSASETMRTGMPHKDTTTGYHPQVDVRRRLYLLIAVAVTAGLLCLAAVAMWPKGGGASSAVVSDNAGVSKSEAGSAMTVSPTTGAQPTASKNDPHIEADKLAGQAEAEYIADNYIAARNICTKALLLVPDHYDALMIMCAVHIKLGEMYKSKSYYQKALPYWKKAKSSAFATPLTPEETAQRQKDLAEYGIWIRQKGIKTQ